MTDSNRKEKRRIPYRFGEKLRKAREHKGLTLKVVAEKAGVSESLVSQIERNKVSPAIDTLLALADALDINLEFLFDEYRRERHVKIIRVHERRSLSEDAVTYEEIALANDKDASQAFEAYIITIPAGTHTHRGSYGHIGHEYGIITKGKIVLKYEENEYELNTGDSVSFPSGSAHTLENKTKNAVEAIWIVTPPQRFV
ncbi:MAG: helix-turn-helix transcriptional regulator [Treponema sp.]|nr:helix-turn-helix transcriptional regulator [Treponema sp.]